MTTANNISIVTELYGNRGLCWNPLNGFQSFILIQKQSNLVIGDRVICNELVSDECTIDKVLDADNSLKKMSGNGSIQNIANNVTNAIIVVSPQPKANLFLLDKLILIAEMNECKINIVINKSDLEHYSLKKELIYYESLGYPVTIVSAIKDSNKADLLSILKNETSLLLGQSGVGKSTLINWLIQEETIKTNTLSEKNKRGRHTTTTTKLHILNDGIYLFDTPGMENLHPDVTNKHLIQNGFREIDTKRNECKYRDCLHISEPKCSVKDMMLLDESSKRRHKHYMKIIETIS
ncbi:MAG: ribosome small subunit-dependent GTPase A [Gammaproteobacteria bacterium]|nr:ribosome small subunit-dependent GTPase A [Gammaproteobacteria bacterium]MDP6147158.1 ribosome small subunit-dependent GTPase A [Gammaproteobacteria bacterium]|tara:strand:+ start:2238 stop:3116 length:879 start_codon:yes stop_codon:yes gene_type:complete